MMSKSPRGGRGCRVLGSHWYVVGLSVVVLCFLIGVTQPFRSDESRQCMGGCALSQNTFFLEVSMHFRSAGTLVWYGMETT
jgi:hypothetical protein